MTLNVMTLNKIILTKMTLSKTKFSKMTLSKTKFNKMTNSKMKLSMTAIKIIYRYNDVKYDNNYH